MTFTYGGDQPECGETGVQDWRLHDPFAGRSASLARVAARIKEGRLTERSMRGREGDHRAGWGGRSLGQTN